MGGVVEAQAARAYMEVFILSNPIWHMPWLVGRPSEETRDCSGGLDALLIALLPLLVTLNAKTGIVFSKSNVIVEPFYVGTRHVVFSAAEYSVKRELPH